MVTEILSVHGALHIIILSSDRKVLVVNIANVADRVVVVVMIVLRNDVGISLRHFSRFLSVLQQDLLVL